jgi:hypothetical protein
MAEGVLDGVAMEVRDDAMGGGWSSSVSASRIGRMGLHTTTKRAQYNGNHNHNHNHEKQKDSRRRPTSRDVKMQRMEGGGGMNE